MQNGDVLSELVLSIIAALSRLAFVEEDELEGITLDELRVFDSKIHDAAALSRGY